MDQIRIGKFIAERRRSEGLTQAELAEALGISDKTVSKWECGKGLPEVSLMLPLCERLHISVNDLLSGARVTEEDYRRRAEENLLSLVQENHENRKNFGLSLVCGIVTVIAVCALTALASFLELPAPVRVALLILAVATAAAGIGAAVLLDVRAGYFECPHCGALFVPTAGAYVKGLHTFTRRQLTCPECGKTGMCKKRLTRKN